MLYFAWQKNTALLRTSGASICKTVKAILLLNKPTQVRVNKI